MIKVIEQTKGKELMYVMYIDDNFDGVTQINILYRTTECYVNDSKYYFIYDGAMNPIRESFEFLNNYYGTKSINTRTMALHALKILYSYEKIIGTKLEDFTSTDLIGFKEFLLGFCRKGKVIEFANLTERQPDTVNMYLGIYRAYLKSQGKKNQYLEESSGKSVSYISNYDYTMHKSAGYKSNVKTVTKTEIPQYISVDEFSHIISLIRKKYSKREECIIRLMYEMGMRIGEVLGLTNEDVRCEQVNGSYYYAIYIRNRVCDKYYQLAKSVRNPVSATEYKGKKYNTINYGYQMLFVTEELFQLICDYIEEAHSKARDNYEKRYKKSYADIVTDDEENFYIFVNNYGSPLSNITWNSILKNIFNEAGIIVDKHIREHNLSHRFRHGFAMFQVQYMKRDAVELSKLMRHSSISSTLIYYNPTISDKIKLKTEFTKELYSILPELKNI